MDSFYIISNQLFQFFVMMVCGYWAAHRGILTQSGLGMLSGVIIRLLLPVLIFANALDGTTRQILFDCYPMILLGAGIYAGLIGVHAVSSRALGLSGNKRRIYEATMSFGNVGFLGIPILSAAFPGYGGIYIALFTIVDQIVLWTYGLYLTTPKEQMTSFQIRKFFNPALGAIILALAMVMANIAVPAPLEHALLTVGRTATPMALIYLGALLHYSRWQVAAKSKELYIGIITKMVLFPVVFFEIIRLVCHDLAMVRAAALIAGLPTMAVIAMLAQSNENHGEYALGMVLLTTVASLLTLTGVSYVIFNIL